MINFSLMTASGSVEIVEGEIGECAVRLERYTNGEDKKHSDVFSVSNSGRLHLCLSFNQLSLLINLAQLMCSKLQL